MDFTQSHVVVIFIPPAAPKELWCFACNSMKIVCLHENCAEYCDMCDRIKAIVMRTNGPL
jgi:hypothetical protein